MQKIKSKILLVIIVPIILSSLFMPIAVAKYKTSNKYNEVLEVAEPIFIVEGIETSKINAINNVGYYEFTVKNYNDTNVSETGFLYTIEIVSNTDESIKFELYKGVEQIKLENLKTEKLSIAANEKIEQKYKLKVTYDSSLGTKGKDILEEVQIKVHSEQEQLG